MIIFIGLLYKCIQNLECIRQTIQTFILVPTRLIDSNVEMAFWLKWVGKKWNYQFVVDFTITETADIYIFKKWGNSVDYYRDQTCQHSYVLNYWSP